MIAGRRYWIVVWYGILLLGVLGLWASLYWGRRTRWRNLDEVLRALGTVLVSTGMLLLLQLGRVTLWRGAGDVLLAVALGCFIGAFALGRRAPTRPSGELVAPPLLEAERPPPPARPPDVVTPGTSSPGAPPQTSRFDARAGSAGARRAAVTPGGPPCRSGPIRPPARGP